MPIPNNKLPITIFENEGVSFDIRVDSGKDTVWLSQNEIAQLFDKDRTVITKHINKMALD